MNYISLILGIVFLILYIIIFIEIAKKYSFQTCVGPAWIFIVYASLATSFLNHAVKNTNLV